MANIKRKIIKLVNEFIERKQELEYFYITITDKDLLEMLRKALER